MDALEAQLQMVDVKADAQSAASKAMKTEAQAVHFRTQTLVEEAIEKIARRLKVVEEGTGFPPLGADSRSAPAKDTFHRSSLCRKPSATSQKTGDRGGKTSLTGLTP